MELIRKYKYHLLLHFIVLIFGFTAILGDIISIPSSHLVWYRMLLAFAVLMVFLKVARWDLSGLLKHKLMFFGTGFVIALHWFFFFESVEVSKVSICLAAMSSGSLFVAFLEPLIFQRKIRWLEVFFGVAIIGALTLIFQVEPEYQLGIIYGLISALAAALFSTLNGRYRRQGHKAHTITLYEMIGGVFALTIYLLLNGEMGAAFFQVPQEDWIWIGILAVICTSFAFVASVEIMKELSPFTVALTINLEPVYGILLALAIFGQSEYMSQSFYWAVSVIILTILANAWYKNRLKKKEGKAA